MSSMIDLTGERFGRLTVIRSEGKNRNGSYMWLCECDCGNTKVLNSGELRRGNVRSCGCLSRELARERFTKHGYSRTKIYSEWKKMIQRCGGNNAYNSLKYSQRGIKVCDLWLNDFHAFLDHVSQLPHYDEPGYSLDRIDNDGDYEPGNVRWADAITQANNRTNNVYITYEGETHTMSEWARILGMSYSKLKWRLYSGWPIEKRLKLIEFKIKSLRYYNRDSFLLTKPPPPLI